MSRLAMMLAFACHADCASNSLRDRASEAQEDFEAGTVSLNSRESHRKGRSALLQRAGKELSERGIGITHTGIMGVDFLEQLHCNMPLCFDPFSLPSDQAIGLVIVDEVNGFCTIGAGNLAPRSSDSQITAMVEETDRLAREFSSRNWPMLVLLDTHDASKPEIPYPPHCIEGSGEENLVPALQWLEQDKNAFLLRKDCINGFIGGLQADGSNLVVDWVRKNKVQVVSFSTDYMIHWVSHVY
ncbi:hypothetical protein L7F22_048175 [Adiantum nelumboides]|nr:hypothetical protein [Adiantum nelumboides]